MWAQQRHGVVYGTGFQRLETNVVYLRRQTHILVQSPKSSSMSLCHPLVVFSGIVSSIALSHTPPHTHIHPAIAHVTHIWTNTHRLPPVSVSRLIWCNTLCSKHSWSARVNKSCQTWVGRLRGQDTGGSRHTPPHDSPADTPAQSHPPGALLHPSWLSPLHWEDHLHRQESVVRRRVWDNYIAMKAAPIEKQMHNMAISIMILVYGQHRKYYKLFFNAPKTKTE